MVVERGKMGKSEVDVESILLCEEREIDRLL